MSLADATDRVRDAGGVELAERLAALDGLASSPRPSAPARPAAPERSARLDYDVVLAGGGLSLLCAPLLAARGLSVAVFDRGQIGAVHREWNASLDELSTLWETGLLPEATVRSLIVNQYRRGECRWHGGGVYPVTGALDCAVHAGTLLSCVRERALEAGVRLFDYHAVTSETGGPSAVRFSGTDARGARFEATAGIFLDARGAASPWARGDLTCPTVGGVMTGLEEGQDDPSRVDPGIGEILVTAEGVTEGRQHIWEVFPGRPGEVAVYLFAYEPAAARRPGDLTRLYARFFERLPEFKRGGARLLRPTFGHISGWSRRGRGPRSDHPRIMLVGDAAARHSPLTFCGFGKMLRSFGPIADAVARSRESDRPPGPLHPDEPVHALTGALAWLMANPSTEPGRSGELNRLLDVAFFELHALGPGPYRDLLRDRMSPREFLRFVRATARRQPFVYREILRTLGPLGASAWATRAAGRALFDSAARPTTDR